MVLVVGRIGQLDVHSSEVEVEREDRGHDGMAVCVNITRHSCLRPSDPCYSTTSAEVQARRPEACALNVGMSEDRPCEACAVPFSATTRPGGRRQPRQAGAADARTCVLVTTRHTKTTHDDQRSKPRCRDLTSDLWPEVLTLATHRCRLSRVREGRLGGSPPPFHPPCPGWPKNHFSAA